MLVPPLASLLLLLVAPSSAESSSASCVSDTLDVLTSESIRADLDRYATYNFCPNTTVSIGAPVAGGGAAVGSSASSSSSSSSPPLAIFNPRVRVLCGENGSSSDGCVIDATPSSPGGSASSGMIVGSVSLGRRSDLLAEYLASGSAGEGAVPPGGDGAPDSSFPVDVEIVGMTFRGGLGGRFLHADVAPAGVTFRDCVFTDGKSKGAALIMEEPEPILPSSFPSLSPTSAASPAPSTSTPPTSAPSPAPTSAPTSSHSPTSSPRPTGVPSVSSRPTPSPSRAPSSLPSVTSSSSPTSVPSRSPTRVPTDPPTPPPTYPPTLLPTESPTYRPTDGPTESMEPTPGPTMEPLAQGRCDALRPCPGDAAPCCSRWGSCGNGEGWCGGGNCVSRCWDEKADAAVEPDGVRRTSEAEGGAARRRMSESDDPTPRTFEFRFVGCRFTGNRVDADDDGGGAMAADVSAVMANMGGTVKIEDCRFVDNTLPPVSEGFSAVVAGISGSTSVVRSCFLRNSRASANVVNLAVSGSTYTGVEGGNFGDVDDDRGCNGAVTVTGGDVHDRGSWSLGCDSFVGEVCSLDPPPIATDVPTDVPTSDPTMFPTDAPAPSARPTPAPTLFSFSTDRGSTMSAAGMIRGGRGGESLLVSLLLLPLMLIPPYL